MHPAACSCLPDSLELQLRACVQCAGSWPAPVRAQAEFSDAGKRYRLRPPEGWEQTSKAGADVLFQSPEEKGTNLGVTITPVRIDSLAKFGSLDIVGQRMLNVERGKVCCMVCAVPACS